MAEITLHVLKPSVNNLTVRVFVRAAGLDFEEQVKPIEQHGFTLADFLPDRTVLRFFKWDLKSESPDAIDRPIPRRGDYRPLDVTPVLLR